MGRITPSFRTRYTKEIQRLKDDFQYALIDPDRRQAFDLLLKEVWGPEQAAMNNSNIVTILDGLNITANLHNTKIIELLRKRLEEKDETIEDLKQKLDALETRIK